ncbi:MULTISPECIES: exodeoxyribonuclease V subunit beta [Acidobacteriaceae]|uniref:UvrD-helicase domain-containing protein n=1 Tax=Acidobacteriaceae TaxID=204434 RepID=UPI00131C3FE5|nr:MULTISPECIES: UvrD-helicase domain-containing protein [Acidobacteriaceae]MDW5266280.1 UvrD-helicase domain-containing protein [Edaphobacter sp.]
MTKLFVVGSEPETQSNPDAVRPPDWSEREKALDIRQSWIVEAPAGSGKTGLLIQRYLKLLGDESVEQPEQVLAITFTVKATGEIRERVVTQLEKASRNEPLQRDSEFERETRALAEAVLRRDQMLGWGLLEHPRRLRVRTIDSVCAEIAGSLPVLSGGGGGQSPVLDASELHREAARRTLMQLGGQNHSLNAALRLVLLHRDGNLAECERLLAGMLALRDQWGELVPLTGRDLDDAYLDEIVLPRLERALDQAICAGLTRLSQTLPADILQELSHFAGELGHASGYKGSASPIAICAGLHTAPEESAEHLAHWRALIHLLTRGDGSWRSGFRGIWLKFEIGKNDAARLKDLVEELRHRDDILAAIQAVNYLPPAKYPQEQWVVAKALFRVLSHALAELQLVFAERGECDFAELGLLAKTALRRENGVHDLEAALGMRLQHLLVDEMQDTSTSQYELIQLLTQNWDGHSQTVFLVGDPKQSIYLFRQARVERFVQTMQAEQLGDLPVGSLRLTANFRSQQGLVSAFNDDFSLIFPNAATSGEVEYVLADAIRGRSSNGASDIVWHANRLPDADTPAHRKQTKADAQSIRAIIEQWQARPLPEERSEPWKIAVLVRSRNHLADIVVTLEKDNGAGPIPYRAVDIKALGEQREVLDLFALTRALLHPADRVAWFAVLHAPWCGLGSSELHILAGADEGTWAERSIDDVLAERGHLLSDESCERLTRIWPVLQSASEQRGRLTTAQWVERTWRSLGGDAYLTPEKMANARRYLQLLDEIEEHAGVIDLSLLKTRLDRLYAEAAISAGAVDLMTIHGAKGLEWDVVIVPGLEKRARVSGGRLLTWNEIDSGGADAAHVVLAPIVGKGEESRELNDWLNNIEKARDAAERKRLFYVACTRAKEELHLFAAPEAKSDGSISQAYGSLLSAAWPAAERHFMAEHEAADSVQTTPLLSNQESSPTSDAFIGNLAAAAVEERPAMLERLPLDFLPAARFAAAQKLSYGDIGIEAPLARFERPEGSFEARAFGNVVHEFLELIAKQLEHETHPKELLNEIATWEPRISAVLRGDGVAASRAKQLASRVRTALENTLRNAEGRWILGTRKEAFSEIALTSWAEARRSVRLDRIFRAGATPLAEGDDYLWIVDYKTTTHGSEGIEAFLAAEQAKYSAQLQTYAQTINSAGRKIRLALYYPLLSQLTWWAPETA